MNKTSDKHHKNSNNNADISELFERQSAEVPAALDELILSSAATAVQHSSNAKRSAWFAIAAMLVMGVGLYPLLNSFQTNAPPFSQAPPPANNVPVELSTSDQSTVMEKAAPTLSTAEDVAQDRRLREARDREDIDGMEALEVETPAMGAQQPSPMVTPSNAVALPQENETSVNATATSAKRKTLDNSAEAVSATSYRDTAQSWIDKIISMHEQGDSLSALAELSLFSKAHPEHPLINTLPQKLRLAFENP